MRVITDVRIRGYHIDHFGHVNHARYIEFLEEGRWQYLEQQPLLVDYCHREGLVHAVVNINIDYRRPALMGNVLQIETEVLKAGESSVVMLQTVTQKGTEILVAEAEVTNVFMDKKSQRVVPLNGELVGLWPDLGK